jgi:hypothetical protein
MNSFADEYNHDQTRTNPFDPLLYGQVADWIERQCPETIAGLGWGTDDDLFKIVNQEFALFECPPTTDEI